MTRLVMRESPWQSGARGHVVLFLFLPSSPSPRLAETTTMPLLALPFDIIYYMFRVLDGVSRCHLRATCVALHEDAYLAGHAPACPYAVARALVDGPITLLQMAFEWDQVPAFYLCRMIPRLMARGEFSKLRLPGFRWALYDAFAALDRAFCIDAFSEALVEYFTSCTDYSCNAFRDTFGFYIPATLEPSLCVLYWAVTTGDMPTIAHNFKHALGTVSLCDHGDLVALLFMVMDADRLAIFLEHVDLDDLWTLLRDPPAARFLGLNTHDGIYSSIVAIVESARDESQAVWATLRILQGCAMAHNHALSGPLMAYLHRDDDDDLVFYHNQLVAYALAASDWVGFDAWLDHRPGQAPFEFTVGIAARVLRLAEVHSHLFRVPFDADALQCALDARGLRYAPDALRRLADYARAHMTMVRIYGGDDACRWYSRRKHWAAHLALLLEDQSLLPSQMAHVFMVIVSCGLATQAQRKLLAARADATALLAALVDNAANMRDAAHRCFPWAVVEEATRVLVDVYHAVLDRRAFYTLLRYPGARLVPRLAHFIRTSPTLARAIVAHFANDVRDEGIVGDSPDRAQLLLAYDIARE
jgi:hypothetical protein